MLRLVFMNLGLIKLQYNKLHSYYLKNRLLFKRKVSKLKNSFEKHPSYSNIFTVHLFKSFIRQSPCLGRFDIL